MSRRPSSSWDFPTYSECLRQVNPPAIAAWLRYSRGAMHVYRLTVGDGRDTEELVTAGAYGYAHSCLTSENFPVGRFGGKRTRYIVLLEIDRAATAAEVITLASERGLERPTYEDALHFGIEHSGVQLEWPVVFLHDPWFGFFVRRDVLGLWSNGGLRELGLEDFDGTWSPGYRFAFVLPP